MADSSTATVIWGGRSVPHNMGDAMVKFVGIYIMPTIVDDS